MMLQVSITQFVDDNKSAAHVPVPDLVHDPCHRMPNDPHGLLWQNNSVIRQGRGIKGSARDVTGLNGRAGIASRQRRKDDQSRVSPLIRSFAKKTSGPFDFCSV